MWPIFSLKWRSWRRNSPPTVSLAIDDSDRRNLFCVPFAEALWLLVNSIMSDKWRMNGLKLFWSNSWQIIFCELSLNWGGGTCTLHQNFIHRHNCPSDLGSQSQIMVQNRARWDLSFPILAHLNCTHFSLTNPIFAETISNFRCMSGGGTSNL